MIPLVVNQATYDKIKAVFNYTDSEMGKLVVVSDYVATTIGEIVDGLVTDGEWT